MEPAERGGPEVEGGRCQGAGRRKSALERKSKLLDQKLGEAKHALEQARSDLEALGNALTPREQYIAILARQKSHAHADEEIEIDVTGHNPYGHPLNRDVTTTTTSFADGVAKVDKVRTQQQVNQHGITNVDIHEQEVKKGNTTLRTSDETTSRLSSTGTYSKDEVHRQELEGADGRKVAIEHKVATEATLNGVSRTRMDTIVEQGGRSQKVSGTNALEAGEGKLSASRSGSTTTIDSAGHATTASSKARASLLSGKEGTGAGAEAQRGLQTNNKSGFNTGAVVSAHANIKVNVEEIPGTPPHYQVNLTVEPGASVTLSAGRKKEGGTSGFSVTANAGATDRMTVSKKMDEKQTAAYLQALKAAEGGKLAATELEFKVIAAGAKDGWSVAQQVWKAKGAMPSREMIAALKEGDSITVAGSSTKGGGVSANVKAVSAGFTVQDADEHSTKLSGRADKKLDASTDATHVHTRSASLGVETGGIGVRVGDVHTVKTSLGFEITIDPAKDTDGTVTAALLACKKDADYEAFVAKYRSSGKIKIESRTDGSDEDDTDTTSLSIGGHKLASMFGQQGVKRSRKTDDKGNLIEEDVTGTAGMGGEILGMGDSLTQKAVAHTDGSGHATLDLTETRSSTDYGKAAQKEGKKAIGVGRFLVPGSEKPGGALADATGGQEDDTAITDAVDLHLSQADLHWIGQIVCTQRGRWDRIYRRSDEKAALRQVGDKIQAAKGAPGVVATEIAAFVGGDKSWRLDTIELFMRPGGGIRLGTADEFPDSLKGKHKDYERLILGPFEPELQRISGTDGPIKAVAYGKKLIDDIDALGNTVFDADDFSKKEVQSEMMSAISHRRLAIMDAIAKFEEKHSEAGDRNAALERLRVMSAQCVRHCVAESGLFAQIDNLVYDNHIVIRERSNARGYIRQLKDLYQIWRGEFDEATAFAKTLGFKEIPFGRTPFTHLEPAMEAFKRLEKLSGL